MKTTASINGTAQQDGSFPPVFVPACDDQVKTNKAEISFFDVKELYELAYNALNTGHDDYKVKEKMALAIKLDMAYRCQLARKNSYKKTSRLDDFRITSKVA